MFTNSEGIAPENIFRESALESIFLGLHEGFEKGKKKKETNRLSLLKTQFPKKEFLTKYCHQKLYKIFFFF